MQIDVQSDVASPAVSSGLARLEVFVGIWRKQGRAHYSPFGPAADVDAVETFQWLTGHAFLVHRIEGRLGTDDMACVEVIGDGIDGAFFAETFYNDGSRTTWRLRQDDHIWLLEGRHGTYDIRCRMIVEDMVIVQRWEYQEGGGRWQVFWDTTLTRLGEPH